MKPLLKRKFFIFSIFSISFSTFVSAYAEQDLVEIKLDNWTAEINPRTLEVIGKMNEKSTAIASPVTENMGDYLNLLSSSEKASWNYPEKNLSVEISKNKNQIIFKFVSSKSQSFEWPSTLQANNADTNNSENIILPDGEGLLIPVTDPFWLENFEKYNATEYAMMEQLTLPFFGNITDDNTVSYISDSSLNNTLKILKNKDNLYVQQEHIFRQKDYFSPYIIMINLDNKKNILAPAIHFRNHLIETKEFVTLKQKEDKNPEIKKLHGAIHTYVWGTGRTVEALKLLSSMGIKNLWLGYDEGKSEKYKVDKKYIETAKKLGFLVAPYDTWENIQDPKTADTPLSIFPNAWPQAAIISEKGKKVPGFHDRGYEASSEYFARQKPINKDLYARAQKFKSTGINSYFLDVDATGSLHDDYSTIHPMNTSKDMLNRITRLKHLRDLNFVLGSETAVSWAVPYLAFAHGNNSVFNNPHWALAKDKKTYGRWYPTERPEIFFKSIIAPKDYENTKYNPLYRIPLFQTVFHDSIITTDRWEIPITKFKNLMEKRLLIGFLYGVPSIWSLDIKQIKDYSNNLKKVTSFFENYHKKISGIQMTKFSYLTEDKLLQQTQFSDIATVTANFSNKIYNNIPANSIEVYYIKENKKEIFTP